MLGLKTGTYLGRHEVAVVTERVNTNTQVQNDLLTHADQSHMQGDHTERLKALLKLEDWSHMTEEQQRKLASVVTRHNATFILDRKSWEPFLLPEQ